MLITIVRMVSEICLTQQHIASAIKAMKSRKAVDEEEAEDDISYLSYAILKKIWIHSLFPKIFKVVLLIRIKISKNRGSSDNPDNKGPKIIRIANFFF